MGYNNVKMKRNLGYKFTYNFVVHSNERARRKLDMLRWNLSPTDTI